MLRLDSRPNQTKDDRLPTSGRKMKTFFFESQRERSRNLPFYWRKRVMPYRVSNTNRKIKWAAREKIEFKKGTVSHFLC